MEKFVIEKNKKRERSEKENGVIDLMSLLFVELFYDAHRLMF